MFLRRFERRKNGKPHTYWALVEAYRTAKGSRQRVVAYLGELSPGEQDGWAKLGAHLGGESDTKPRSARCDRPRAETDARRPQWSLFDPPRRDEPRDDEPVLVKLSSIRLQRTRDFGDVWLAWGLWRMLGLDVLLEELIEPGREDVSWGTMAAVLTIARFCEPSSELHIADTWYRGTALDELLGVAPQQVHTDRLYTALDQLLPHKDAIEKHLRQRAGELFELKCDLLLYDVTSTYFEGDMEGCAIAQLGYSRDSRPDRPQVCIGLVVTEDGFPLGHEVFAGNRHDSTTVRTIVESLEKKYGTLNRVWVMDRGMVSEENLKYLRERGGQYIVGTPKAMLRRFERQLTEQNWTVAQQGVEVKLVPSPDGAETFLLARSADRRAKELAMHEKFSARLAAGLKRMQAAAESGRLKDEAAAGERLGRLKQQNWRASQAFDVTIRKLAEPRGRQRLEISWQRRAQFADWSQLADGCYLLRSNLTGVDAATLWKRYIQLTEAEWAFRIAKDELSIRPIWHHKEARVKSHILVCFLAYVLWKTLAGWMRVSGLGDAPRTVIDELSKLKSGDVTLRARSTREGRTDADRQITLRCVTEPDAGQSTLLHRLGLTLPRRLRRLDAVTRM
ncbi:MAG: IS1634 family transposase [Nevskiales bacterium]